MPNSKTVVLDVEGLLHRKETFVVKEFYIYIRDYLDCVSFLPQTSYSELTTRKNQFFKWLTRNLHGTEWETGQSPSIYLAQIN